MVEADIHLKQLPTSILDICKVFQHIDVLSIGIWKQSYTVIPTQLLEECARANPDTRICPLTHASVDQASQAESVGSNLLVSILIAIRRSPIL